MATEVATPSTGRVMTPTKQAGDNLFKFLLKKTSDRELASRCASDIHGPVCMFGNSQRSLPPSKDGLSPGKATRPLERLERTAKSGGVRWTNAWNALTRAAWDCLVSGNPGKPVPLTVGVPTPAEVTHLIPGALARARRRDKALTERNVAVVAILRAYRLIYNAKPTVKAAPVFIEQIEKIYGDLLPAAGFNVGRTSALHALIGESLKHH
jgi:hypothetical protein